MSDSGNQPSLMGNLARKGRRLSPPTAFVLPGRGKAAGGKPLRPTADGQEES
jgi:hypothetical protein